MFKVDNKKPRTTSMTPGVFIANFEHISHLDLVFLLLILNKQMLTGKILINPVQDSVPLYFKALPGPTLDLCWVRLSHPI